MAKRNRAVVPMNAQEQARFLRQQLNALVGLRQQFEEKQFLALERNFGYCVKSLEAKIARLLKPRNPKSF